MSYTSLPREPHTVELLFKRTQPKYKAKESWLFLQAYASPLCLFGVIQFRAEPPYIIPGLPSLLFSHFTLQYIYSLSLVSIL